jgi:ribosomal protein S18 acetylase RimI-like enzyme
MNIRVADARDGEALVAFNMAMARETEAKELDEDVLRAGVQALFEKPQNGFYVVAEEGDVTVGSAMITFEWSDWRNGLFWWIQSVYVLPEHRRRGVYRRLYEYIKELAAADRTVCGFRLYVERENEVAQRTYERLGMTETYYKMFEEVVSR